MSKCEFGLTEMLYLGHVIGPKDRVKVHQEKIKAILDFPTPSNVTELRGFLGICMHYRRFLRGFSQLAAPLIDLWNKGVFQWMQVAHEAFEYHKKVMSSCYVLSLPDFTRPFVLECDALGEGGCVDVGRPPHSL